MFVLDISKEKEIEHKVIMLYMMDKMDAPMTASQVTQFTETMGLMNFVMVGRYLSEMTEAGYVAYMEDEGGVKYYVTEDGATAMEMFIKRVPSGVKTAVGKYVADNKGDVKRDLQVFANTFYNAEVNEYTVKCGAYEGEIMLLELNVSVVTKEQAIVACENWRNNINKMYGKIIGMLLETPNKKTE